ncbi:ANTAR domain-containing protein [Streptomyces sp. NBC_00328]|uniref:ANTAR domain-containing protein n=1 Tax=Streptomyces sp. NBC_00328 TaxID=2903646 RepID=UPI002E2BF42F|nr:ANTAR domain-containing protein [Streptomyces sp. NBC_00328]
MREHPLSPPEGSGDGAAHGVLACGARVGGASPFLETAVYPAGSRTLVVVAGEIDIDTAQPLQHNLCAALAQACQGLDLDLARVDFCDCSGLRVLLRLRSLALAQGKTVHIRAAGRAVERLLMLTGTAPLFAPSNGAGPHLDGKYEKDLLAEVIDLRRAMRSRPVIDLARGVLMATFRLNEEDAWGVLVEVSQRGNTKLRLIAEELVAAITGDPLPGHLKQQISAAVAKVSDEAQSRGHHRRRDWVPPAARAASLESRRRSA